MCLGGGPDRVELGWDTPKLEALLCRSTELSMLCYAMLCYAGQLNYLLLSLSQVGTIHAPVTSQVDDAASTHRDQQLAPHLGIGSIYPTVAHQLQLTDRAAAAPHTSVTQHTAHTCTCTWCGPISP